MDTNHIQTLAVIAERAVLKGGIIQVEEMAVVHNAIMAARAILQAKPEAEPPGEGQKAKK